MRALLGAEGLLWGRPPCQFLLLSAVALGIVSDLRTAAHSPKQCQNFSLFCFCLQQRKNRVAAGSRRALNKDKAATATIMATGTLSLRTAGKDGWEKALHCLRKLAHNCVIASNGIHSCSCYLEVFLEKLKLICTLPSRKLYEVPRGIIYWKVLLFELFSLT